MVRELRSHIRCPKKKKERDRERKIMPISTSLIKKKNYLDVQNEGISQVRFGTSIQLVEHYSATKNAVIEKHLVKFMFVGKKEASQVVLVVKNLHVNAGDMRDMGSIPGS